VSKPTHASHQDARPLSHLFFGSFLTTPFFRQILTGLLGDNLSCLARATLGSELLLKPSTRAFCYFQLLMRLF
jgi:hypothetical protein